MKKWYKSKTLIFNGVAAIVTVAMTLSEQNLSPKVLEVMGTIAAVGNIILRFRTIEPIKKAKENIKEVKDIAPDVKTYVDEMVKQTKKDLPKFKK